MHVIHEKFSFKPRVSTRIYLRFFNWSWKVSSSCSKVSRPLRAVEIASINMYGFLGELERHQKGLETFCCMGLFFYLLKSKKYLHNFKLKKLIKSFKLLSLIRYPSYSSEQRCQKRDIKLKLTSLRSTDKISTLHGQLRYFLQNSSYTHIYIQI